MAKEGLCQQCQHFEYCTRLCPAAKKFSYKDSSYTVEYLAEDPEVPGRYQHVMRPNKQWEVYLSQLDTENDEGEIDNAEETQIGNYEAYKEFWDNVFYKTKKIEIISDVLFAGMSFEEIAEKHGFKDAHNAHALFNRYIRQFARRISQLEEEYVRMKQWKTAKERLEKKHGRLPKGLQQFFCFHCLGMTVDEIMAFFGNGRSTIHNALNRYTKHIQNGELKLKFDEDGYIVEVSRRAGKSNPKNRKNKDCTSSSISPS